MFLVLLRWFGRNGAHRETMKRVKRNVETLLSCQKVIVSWQVQGQLCNMRQGRHPFVQCKDLGSRWFPQNLLVMTSNFICRGQSSVH